MSYTINSLDKRSGITYVYAVDSYWDKEKQQSRSKRTLIGKLDPVTGEMIPTDGRGKKRIENLKKATAADAIPLKTGPIPAIHTERTFYGATYLLDQIGEVTGVTMDLKTCFPISYKQILSIAYYLILEDQNPLFRFKKWGLIHRHPYGKDIPSQRSSEAIDYERGNTNGIRKRVVTVIPVPEYKGIEIKRIREELKITQASFAELMGVSVKTVEAWETGRNIPQGPAQRMLDLLKNESDIVDKYVKLLNK